MESIFLKVMEKGSRRLTEKSRQLVTSNRILRKGLSNHFSLSRLNLSLLHCRSETEICREIEIFCWQKYPYYSGCLLLTDDLESRLRRANSWGEPPFLCPDPSFPCPAMEGRKPIVSLHGDISRRCEKWDLFPDYHFICASVRAGENALGALQLCRKRPERKPSGPLPEFESGPDTFLIRKMTEFLALNLVNVRQIETLRIISCRDPLTGLYNRRYLEETLERETHRALRRMTSLGLIMMDVDYFKTINDAYGHETGDIVLRNMGEFLKLNTRGEDMICRYGGDEFLAVLIESSPKTTGKRAEEFRRVVQQHLKVEHMSKVIPVTISAGVAVFPEHGQTIREVLKFADSALYRAKRSGRNRTITYNPKGDFA